MAVPDTNTFSFIDVSRSVYDLRYGLRNLNQAFIDADDALFDLNYKGSKNNLLNFRNYNQSVTDYDGNVYPIITIGTQVWMAQNLKVKHYNDGTPLLNCTTLSLWNANRNICYNYWNNVDYDTLNGWKFGLLYSGNVATGWGGAKNIAPIGWHVPTLAEFTTLATYLGGASVAGGKLKSTPIANGSWNTPNTGATNSTFFNGIGAGMYQDPFDSTGWQGLGSFLQMWSQTIQATNHLYSPYLQYNGNYMTLTNYSSYAWGYSIRCIKD